MAWLVQYYFTTNDLLHKTHPWLPLVAIINLLKNFGKRQFWSSILNVEEVQKGSLIMAAANYSEFIENVWEVVDQIPS